MNFPETPPTDEQLAALMSAIDRSAPPPDAEFLERLRAETAEVFATAPALAISALPRKRTMLLSAIRWFGGVAALLIVSAVIARVAFLPGPDPKPDPDEKFAMNDTLIDDGRIGKVTDAQGVVSIKPVMHERWSPASANLVLKPGDLLRTDSRGANAAAVRMLNSTALIVGPHSTVELVKASEVHLLAGEVEIAAAADAPVELQGPDKQTISVKGKQLYRVEGEKLVRVERDPLWLQGFKGTTANESIGSLIATVDGRNEPLTVGYHRVTVDIRDQIARTTIEESFVNRTKAVLEGVFHFPLPADASISGFGMWIGDQLVEADVVEKQRAREIYETILREKRDPGLLEWAGGNIFKARVYPIPAMAEKRIRISYTQVLPLRGNRYRYSYALQSELLKAHPLRELSIDVKVNSAVPLKGVSSPTHQCRIAKTDNSGHVEFAAQEYVPTRDFEAVVEVAGRQPDIAMIPHRRGDDGYFLLQLTPPDAGGEWERPLIPDGEPLKLLVLADTSASIDRGQRATQNALLAVLFAALTPKDRINVASCDVNCDWVFEKGVSATAANLDTIRNVLAKRVSLGWTDLDKAFASALAKADANTQVLYLGDGVPTTGDADPVAFAQRLHRLAEGKPGTCHAIALGSGYEAVALKAIAAIGGGSVRHVSGEKGPQAVVSDLLGEIVAPALRDLKVTFTGLRTARVYPEELPNIPAGSQQILLGRYLPEGKDQRGEVVVTGRFGGRPVRYTAKVSLKDAEAGNSFIPRLWARLYLDKLLEQGSSESVKNEIIGLSEEYKIITPYTSLLVLESDADRARFAVKRRFEMRDGERFFADGRDNANFELKQKQMRQAGDYRTAQRRSVLAQLLALGRFAPPQMQPGQAGDIYRKLINWESAFEGGSRGGESQNYFGESELLVDSASRFAPAGVMAEYEFAAGAKDKAEQAVMPGLAMAEEPLGRMDVERGEMQSGEWRDDSAKPAGAPQSRGALGLVVADFDSFGLDFAKLGFNYVENDSIGMVVHKRMSPYRREPPSQLAWLDSLFPPLASSPGEPKETPSPWPAAAVELSRSLLRTDALGKLKGGLRIERTRDVFDRYQGELAGRSDRLEFVSPAAWFGRTASKGEATVVNWCDEREFGVFNTAFQLGRVRPSTKADLRNPPLELADHSLAPLHVSYAAYTAAVETLDAGRALLILKLPAVPELEIRILIDTGRHAVLGIEHRNGTKVNAATKFGDFVEVAGSFWAQRVEGFNAAGMRTSLAVQKVTALPPADFAKQMAGELAARNRVLFLKSPLPKVSEAKSAVAAGRATFDDRALLVLHFAASQQWTRAAEHLAECEKLAAGKTGMRWLNYAFLYAGRRHEELRKKLLEEAAALIASTDADTMANDFALAKHIAERAREVVHPDEMLALHDRLRPVYDRQPVWLHAPKTWRTERVALLQQAGQADRALEESRAIAVDFPNFSSAQYQYAQNLANAGDTEAALAWLNRILVPESKWFPLDDEALRGLYAQFLENRGHYRELAQYYADWLAKHPDTEQFYPYYLSALVRSNRAAKAEELTAKWIKDALADGELSPAARARLNAALALALGQGYNLYTYRIQEGWLKPLAEAALAFARRDDRLAAADSILRSNAFPQTDAGRDVRRTLARLFVEQFDALSLAQIEHFNQWLWSEVSLETADWRRLADKLRARWDAGGKPELKNRIGIALVRILDRLGPAESLPFLRVQYEKGPADHRPQYAHLLFEALIHQPWKAEYEDEAFALLDTQAERDGTTSLTVRVAALYRLDDTLLEARYQALLKTLDHPEKLTRTELQAKQREFRKKSREEFADRLKREVPKRAESFAGWLVIERTWIDVQLDRDLKAAADDCWRILETPAPKANEGDARAAREAALDDQLRTRARTTLAHLAARKGADPALVDRLVKFLDAQLKQFPGEPRWKVEKYRLLIALDKSAELEAALRQWLALPDPDSRWKVALGYLLAEGGKVADAIKLFEAVEADDELGPAAYRSLADWYLVENRREAHDRAVVASYKTLEENQLSQRIWYYYQPWLVQDHLPTQLDPEVLQVFKALFEKSAAPQNYLGQLQQFYAACRDFRLLAMLADGVVGHTAGKAYPFLGGMSAVLTEIRDEATADELLKRIAEVRRTAKTDIDRRALDLLELQVERRAAELLNQPGPHAAKALAALERAFKGEWSAGEPRAMAGYLAGLGRLPQDALKNEQLRQLDALHRLAAGGSFDRLEIALHYGTALNAYSQSAKAIDVIEAGLKEYEEANQGVLPASANTALGAVIALMEVAGQYERGERLMLAQLKHPANGQQRYWLVLRLDSLYYNAMVSRASVSIGSGPTLYAALQAKLFADLAEPDSNQRLALVGHLCQFYRAARDRGFATAAADLKAFAFDRIPPLLAEETANFDPIVQQVGEALHTTATARDAMTFVLDRIEREPDWLRYTNQRAYSQHGYRLGQWRQEVKPLGDLEPRLLQFVLTALRQSLRDGQVPHAAMFDRRFGYYWPEHEADYTRVTEEVLAERKGSSAAVEQIAEYLYYGLPRETRAIEILYAAHGAKILSEAGQVQLIDYLQRTSRFAESVPLLLPLVELRPGIMSHRTRLMHAYFKIGKRAELFSLLKGTDAYFREKDRWGETPLAALAASCLKNGLFAEAAAYYGELIPLHQRTHPRRGIGNGILSNYYSQAARAYAGLKKTKEAVDMASGAVVSWDPRQPQRANALQVLVQVLADAPDLKAYAESLDREALQSAVVRKAIGLAYIKRGDRALAIPQLRQAAELQPNDSETCAELIKCYDAIGDSEGAANQLLQSVELSRREIKLYEQLGQRYEKLSRPAEAERAYTSVVEMQPNEAESHALLAETRQVQNRSPEAVAQWERAAQLRALEPTGLLKLAAAQIHEKAWDGAAETLRKLRSQTWPARFGDILQQVRALEQQIEKRPK